MHYSQASRWPCPGFTGNRPSRGSGKRRLDNGALTYILPILERIVVVAIKVGPHLQLCRRDPVHHCPIPKDRQVEAMPVKRDELRTQFADLFHKPGRWPAIGDAG